MTDDAERAVRILIVDDEPIIAMDLEYMLTDAGFVVTGVTGDLQTALAMVERRICDAAVLDANLDGVSAAPIATALTALGLPFLVLSGYAPDQQPDALRAGPCLQKPADPDQIVTTIRQMLSRA